MHPTPTHETRHAWARDRSSRAQKKPPGVTARLAVEAGSPQGWREWVGDQGDIIGITRFGASAPDKELFEHYGFTVENVLARAKKLVSAQ